MNDVNIIWNGFLKALHHDTWLQIKVGFVLLLPLAGWFNARRFTRRNVSFVQSEAKVFKSHYEFYHDAKGKTRHRFDLLYEYRFRGDTYTARTYRPGFTMSLFIPSRIKKAARQFEPGRTYPCYVNPDSPTEAYLLPNPDRKAMWFFHVSVVFFTMVLLALIILDAP